MEQHYIREASNIKIWVGRVYMWNANKYIVYSMRNKDSVHTLCVVHVVRLYICMYIGMYNI